MNATNRFLNRNRPSVPPRTDEISQALKQEPKNLSDVLEGLPKITTFQLRVEEGYKSQIQAIAREMGVTPETLIQGIWDKVQDQPQLLQEAGAIAQRHLQTRKKLGKVRFAHSRTSKILSEM